MILALRGAVHHAEGSAAPRDAKVGAPRRSRIHEVAHTHKLPAATSRHRRWIKAKFRQDWGPSSGSAGSPANMPNDKPEERDLVTRVLEAQAEERERVARELHDETGQTLTALLVGLRGLENQVESQARERVAELRERVRHLIENVGRLARGLHPPALGELSLAEVVEQQVTEFADASGIDTALEVDEPEQLERLSRPAALAVYRIVQEGLTNVWRHSGATRVLVRLITSDNQVGINVNDNGNGLAHRRPEGRGIGIRLLQRRVEGLGGALTVDAVVGKGTTLRAQLPLPKS